MGKLDLFKIVITNPQCVLQAGERLTGHVLVTLNENMKMRGVFISFKGKQHVKFVKHSKDDKSYSATEYSFDEQHALYKPNDETGYLPQGAHRFDFQYQLTSSLPSTFEGKYGYVRYYVKCKIDRPWKFDHSVKEAFTVLSILDLNTEPEAEMPIHMEKQDTSYNCGCCGEDGQATLKLDLPRSGYVPGESIPVTAMLESSVSSPLNFTVELMQTITYFAHGKEKEEKQQVAQLQPVNVQRGEVHSHNGTGLLIPPVPPSRLVGCDLIDIVYTLRACGDAGIFEVKCKTEIVIGTIPLSSVLATYRAPPVTDIAGINIEPTAPFLPPAGATPYPPTAPYPPAAPTQYGIDARWKYQKCRLGHGHRILPTKLHHLTKSVFLEGRMSVMKMMTSLRWDLPTTLLDTLITPGLKSSSTEVLKLIVTRCLPLESSCLPLDSSCVPLDSSCLPFEYSCPPLESSCVPLDSNFLPLTLVVSPCTIVVSL